jgi:microcystin-dependent protein
MRHKYKTTICSILLGLIAALSVLAPKPAAAQSEPFLGQLMLFGGNFCPRGWADASGQILSIAQNTALFSLLGTTYGGNGQTTFGLPDLRGRAPISDGQAPGLSPYVEGQVGGTESFTLTINQIPPHTHGVNATSTAATGFGAGTDFLAKTTTPIYANGPPNKVMDPGMIAPAGGGQPVSKRSPYLAIRWCIALEGIFPSRN